LSLKAEFVLLFPPISLQNFKMNLALNKIMIAILLGVSLSGFAQKDNKGISKEIDDVLERATAFMNQSKYDSAQYLISGVQAQSEFPVSKLEHYYLRCYEAEIMYYNALFEQGLNISLWSLDLAKELNSELLQGNSHNFIGLFLLIMQRSKEAIPHFQAAIQLIPEGQQPEYLTKQYHALANLGESYLKIGLLDSAIHYSVRSIEAAESLNKARGKASAQTNIAEAYLLKNDLSQSIAIATDGYNLVKDSDHRDLIQSFCTTLMHAYEKKKLNDSLNYWMNVGLAENVNPLNTDLSRNGFLQQCIDLRINLGDVKGALDLIGQLNTLKQSLHDKQQSLRVAVLIDYYEQNNKLALSKQLTERQQSELKLRAIIMIALAAVVALILFLFFISRKNAKQKQHIAKLQYQEELQKSARELELKALQDRFEALHSERNRIASDLHDDIGAALSSIRIYSGAAQKHFQGNPQESENLIQRINESSTGMMDRMSDIVWSINPKNDNGESLVLRMKSFASEVLGSLDIKVSYKIDEEFEALKPSTTVRRNLYLIFKEAINNVSKYSEATEVTVVLEVTEDVLRMRIEDNGVGFHVVGGMHGNGLTNMNLRAEAMGATFHISSHKGKGTQLMLMLPVTKISDVIA